MQIVKKSKNQKYAKKHSYKSHKSLLCYKNESQSSDVAVCLSGFCFLPLSKTMITSLPGLYNFPLDMKQWMDVELYPKTKKTFTFLFKLRKQYD